MRQVKAPEMAVSGLVGALIEELADNLPDDLFFETVRADFARREPSARYGQDSAALPLDQTVASRDTSAKAIRISAIDPATTSWIIIAEMPGLILTGRLSRPPRSRNLSRRFVGADLSSRGTLRRFKNSAQRRPALPNTERVPRNFSPTFLSEKSSRSLSVCSVYCEGAIGGSSDRLAG